MDRSYNQASSIEVSAPSVRDQLADLVSRARMTKDNLDQVLTAIRAPGPTAIGVESLAMPPLPQPVDVLLDHLNDAIGEIATLTEKLLRRI